MGWSYPERAGCAAVQRDGGGARRAAIRAACLPCDFRLSQSFQLSSIFSPFEISLLPFFGVLMSASSSMNLKIQWKKVEVLMLNSAFTTAGAFDDKLSATITWAAPTILACIDVSIQMLEKAIESARMQREIRLSRATVWMNITKVMGPTLGYPDSDFLKLAAALAVLGVSLAGFVTVALPVAAGGLTVAVGVDLTLAGIGLFFDAIAFAAVQRGIQVKYEPLVRRRFEQTLRLNLAKRYGLEPRLGGGNRLLLY